MLVTTKSLLVATTTAQVSIVEAFLIYFKMLISILLMLLNLQLTLLKLLNGIGVMTTGRRYM